MPCIIYLKSDLPGVLAIMPLWEREHFLACTFSFFEDLVIALDLSTFLIDLVLAEVLSKTFFIF